MGIRLKPYKKKKNAWRCIPEKIRTNDQGRTIVAVEIGKKVKTDEKTGRTLQADLIEDIYMDIITDIFAEHDRYDTTICMGYEPKIIISSHGDLVMHNDKVISYIDTIKEILGGIPTAEKIKVLCQTTNYMGNKAYGGKFTPEIRSLQKKVKEESGVSFSPEFLWYVLMDDICESRPMTEKQEELHWADHKELLEKAQRVLIAREEGKGGSRFEKDVLDELLYRVVSGKLTEKV